MLRLFSGFVLLIILGMTPQSASALSDEDYGRFNNQSTSFKQAEIELSDVWKKLTSLLPEKKRKELVEVQRQWLREERDATAKYYMQSHVSHVDAYTMVTEDQTAYLRRYLQQALKPEQPVSVEGVLGFGHNVAGDYYRLTTKDRLSYLVCYTRDNVSPDVENAAAQESRNRSVRITGKLDSLTSFDCNSVRLLQEGSSLSPSRSAMPISPEVPAISSEYAPARDAGTALDFGADMF